MMLLRFLLLPQVVLNIIGFLCFSVPPQCGERLGLGITALFSPAVRCVVRRGILELFQNQS